MKLRLWSLLLLWMYSTLILEWENISYLLTSFLILWALLHCSGLDRSVRLVRPVCPETVFRGPFVGTIFKPPMDLRSSDNISEVLTCTAPDLHHHRIVFTWSDLWIIWRFSLTNMEHSQLYVRLQFHSKNVLVPKTQISKWSPSK